MVWIPDGTMVGGNVFTVQIANFKTLFPRISYVRVDGNRTSWDPVGERALIRFYESQNIPVSYILPAEWTKHVDSSGTSITTRSIVGKLRDVVAYGGMHWLEGPNEGDIPQAGGQVTPTQIADDYNEFREVALKGLGIPVALGAPSISNYGRRNDLFPSDPEWTPYASGHPEYYVYQGKSYAMQLQAAGVYRLADFAPIHTYPDLGTDPSYVITTTPGAQCQALKTLSGLPVMCTEFGVSLAQAGTLKGGAANVANQAQCYEDARASMAAVGVSMVQYCLPYSASGENSMLQSGNAALSSLGTAIAAKLVAANVQQVG